MHPHVTQPWYTENTGEGGTFNALHKHMWVMLTRESPQEYFLEPTKIILVIYLRNIQKLEAQFWGVSVRVVARRRYLDRFIGDHKLRTEWMAEKVVGWSHLVEVLLWVARQRLQTAYTGMQKFLHQ